jgi:hypothetical protein
MHITPMHLQHVQRSDSCSTRQLYSKTNSGFQGLGHWLRKGAGSKRQAWGKITPMQTPNYNKSSLSTAGPSSKHTWRQLGIRALNMLHVGMLTQCCSATITASPVRHEKMSAQTTSHQLQQPPATTVTADGSRLALWLAAQVGHCHPTVSFTADG